MKDFIPDFSRHTDAELRDLASAIQFEDQPLKARALTQEIVLRWGRAREVAATQRSDAALESGATFAELDDATANGFLWRYLGFSIFSGVVIAFTNFIVTVIIALPFSVVARVKTGSASGFHIPSDVFYLFAALLLVVPVTRIYLKALTSRSFGGLGVRIVRVTKTILSNT